MKRKEIEEFLSELINYIDYDIYKAIFVCSEYGEKHRKKELKKLVEIVEKYLHDNRD